MVHITCTLGDLRRAGNTRDRCGYEFGPSVSHQLAMSRKIGPRYIDKHQVAGGDPVYGIEDAVLQAAQSSRSGVHGTF